MTLRLRISIALVASFFVIALWHQMRLPSDCQMNDILHSRETFASEQVTR